MMGLAVRYGRYHGAPGDEALGPREADELAATLLNGFDLNHPVMARSVSKVLGSADAPGGYEAEKHTSSDDRLVLGAFLMFKVVESAPDHLWLYAVGDQADARPTGLTKVQADEIQRGDVDTGRSVARYAAVVLHPAVEETLGKAGFEGFNAAITAGVANLSAEQDNEFGSRTGEPRESTTRALGGLNQR